MTNSEQRRLTNWRFKLLQAAVSAGNVARTCRHFGISRKTFYKWRRAALPEQQRAPAHVRDRSRLDVYRMPAPTAPHHVSAVRHLNRRASVPAAQSLWRVTRAIAGAATVKNPAGESVPLYEFPREAVREVILGQRANDILEFEILELVTKHPYKNVTVLRAELDQKMFRLNIVRHG
jgi:transposase-like protein